MGYGDLISAGLNLITDIFNYATDKLNEKWFLRVMALDYAVSD